MIQKVISTAALETFDEMYAERSLSRPPAP